MGLDGKEERGEEHIGRETGARYCEVEHVGLVLEGRAAVQMKDHFMGAERYARK